MSQVPEAFVLSTPRSTQCPQATTLTPPCLHPPTVSCDFTEQSKLTRARALASPYLTWDVGPVTCCSFVTFAPPLTMSWLRSVHKHHGVGSRSVKRTVIGRAAQTCFAGEIENADRAVARCQGTIILLSLTLCCRGSSENDMVSSHADIPLKKIRRMMNYDLEASFFPLPAGYNVFTACDCPLLLYPERRLYVVSLVCTKLLESNLTLLHLHKISSTDSEIDHQHSLRN
ncbi:hypothetical protein EDD17DRAFT_313222 [Pisolithus thermaeus]|nr:hypothetical protein EDD17DRAFT_313222 [Pisolithus thermaeus]